MAPHSSERKGRRRSFQILVVFVGSTIVSLPAAFIVGTLMTPVLWKLEPVLGVELAGHSGPSGWILLALSATLTVGVTALYAWTTRPKTVPSTGQDPLV